MIMSTVLELANDGSASVIPGGRFQDDVSTLVAGKSMVTFGNTRNWTLVE